MSGMSLQRILVTGSAGRIGQAAVTALAARGHHVVGLDMRPTPGAAQSIVGNLAQGQAIYEAARGMHALIHLAATPDDTNCPRQPPPHDGDNFLTELLPNNITASYHVLEAARQAKVPRLILASTGQVIHANFMAGDWPVNATTPVTPRYWYACTKVFLEAAGSAYARAHGLTVLAVRLGWCPRDPLQIADLARFDWAQDVYLSPGDAGRFFVAAVETPELPAYSVVYATSRPVAHVRFDLTDARRWCGFEPVDVWPTGAPPTSPGT